MRPKRPYSVLVLCVILLVACSQTPTEQELGVSPVATGAQFVWPAAGWIRATDYYWNGVPHRGDGSADIAAPYGLPVGAARGGTVIEAGTSSTNAYHVRIRHESGYETRYAHLTDPPLVKVGDVVAVNQTLGYNGRTGNAAVPHVHLSITRYGQAQKIPEIDFGKWVNKSSFIPGTYTGLSELPAKTVSFSVKVIEDKLPVYSSASASSSVRGTLTVNTTWSVTGGNVGFYRISYNGAPGYIPMSGVVPSASKVFGVRTTTSTKARSGPGSGYPVETTFSAGTVLSAFGTKNGYYKVLWKSYDKFVHYVWVPTSAAVTTSHFWMHGTFAPKVYIRSGPGMSYPVVETWTFDAYRPAYIVTDNVRGWYKVGSNRWFPGWQTLRK